MGKILKRYSGFYVKPPLLKYAYLMHYNTKTAEEYINKIKRGANQNVVYNISESIKRFFQINDFSKEKLRLFEKAFNKSFDPISIFNNSSDKDYIDMKKIFILLLCLSFF